MSKLAILYIKKKKKILTWNHNLSFSGKSGYIFLLFLHRQCLQMALQVNHMTLMQTAQTQKFWDIINNFN